jgi:hypothetical protein
LPSEAAAAVSTAQDAPADAPAVADTSPAALDQVMAPIALYPDALVMQILAASVNPQEVLDAGNWLLENKGLEGIALDEAAKKVGFGVPMTALLHFPEVVDQMCTNLEWTKQVGADFSADQAAVLDSIQRLRAQAQQAGNLKSTPQQTVATQTDNGKQVIVIQPANPQVVYVPQYNPQTVYVSSGPSTGDVVAASIISFGVGMAVGSLFSNNNYYYAPRWGYGGVYYGGRPWYPHSYVYRPVYGPHYRPAYGYRPPANYPYHRPNYNSNYYNRYRGGNNTININSGNNNRPGNGYNGNNRPGNGNNGNNNNRPGNGNNGGYNKPGNGNNGGYNRPGNNAGNDRPGNPGNSPGYNKPGNNAGNGGYNKPGNNGGNNRPGNPGGGYNGGNTTRPAPDKGYARPGNGGGQPARPGGQNQSRPNNAGGAGGGRPQGQTQQQRPQQTKPAPAFAGGGSNKSVNAASQRGAASSANRGGAGNSARRPK